jgi:hypothetical protein
MTSAALDVSLSPAHTESILMDSYSTLMLGKFLLTFGVLLGIPAWELYSLRREARRSAESKGR